MVTSGRALHILFLTDNFPPEGNAPATRTFEHAKEWVKAGHKVTVITCAPNFPEGVVYEGYKNQWFSKENYEGIEVRRVKTYMTANEGFVKRSLDYMSFMVTGFFAGLFVKKPNVVVATSPQFFCACAGWMLSVFKWKPFVFELRDIWPASIKAVGASRSNWLFAILERLELFLYRRASLIISVTRSFKADLVSRGINGAKIQVVFNGVEKQKFEDLESESTIAELGFLKGKFVVSYIGTIGLAHSVGTIIDAANILKEHKDLEFLIVGGGANASEVESNILSSGLKNIRFLGRQSPDKVPALLKQSNVSIVHLRNDPLFRKVIPSKIFESFAAQTQIIIGVPQGEATDIVEQNKAGITITPEDPEMMAATILQLKSDDTLYNQLKDNCLLAAEKYSRSEMALEMLNQLESISDI